LELGRRQRGARERTVTVQGRPTRLLRLDALREDSKQLIGPLLAEGAITSEDVEIVSSIRDRREAVPREAALELPGRPRQQWR